MSTRSHPRPPSNPLRYERRDNSRPSHDYQARSSHERSARNSGGYAPQPYDAQPHYPAPATYMNGDSQQQYSTQPTRLERLNKNHSRGEPKKMHVNTKTSPLTQHLVAALGEFVGTIMFLWFAFAWHQTVADQTTGSALNGGPSAETVILVSIGYGFSLLVAAWSWYRISGGLFNPAVTLGLVLTGSLPVVRGMVLIPVEIVAGICAAALASCMLPGDIAVVNTMLGEGVSIAQGVFIEMFLTSLLLFTIHMLAAEKTKATFIAPIGIGLALFVAELAGVLYTGGSLNPARSFGPAVVSHQFPGYHWIYWVGPFLGSLLAAGYFHLNKFLHYEEANPGQDSSGGQFGRQDSH